MNLILKLQDKINQLISAYKAQGIVLQNKENKIHSLEKTILEKDKEIAQLQEELSLLKLSKGLKQLDHKEKDLVKKQLIILIEKINTYMKQVK